jgi:hypothetical protein
VQPRTEAVSLPSDCAVPTARSFGTGARTAVRSWLLALLSKVQKQTRLEILPTGAGWLMARSARSATTGVFFSGVPLRRKWRAPRLAAWERPIFDPTRRVPLHPIVAAERREEQRRYRLRKEMRDRQARSIGAAERRYQSTLRHRRAATTNCLALTLRSVSTLWLLPNAVRNKPRPIAYAYALAT